MEIEKQRFNTLEYSPQKCRERLISNGYVYTGAFGWEKPETLEAFELNPNNLENVHAYFKPEMEAEEKRVPEKDEFGNKTGNWVYKKHLIPTGKYKWYPSLNILAYKYYKKYKEQLDLTPKEILNIFKDCERRRNSGELVTVDILINQIPSK